MDNAGERPEGGSLDEAEGSESWYFDLPSGAWERQEQKNRELRQRVLENATDRAERDPFARRKPEPEAKKGGLFGFGRKKEEPAPRESAGGTYRLARGGELPEPPAPRAFDDDDDWSTESFSLPPATAEAPLRPHDDEWAPPPAEDVHDPDAPSSRWEGVFGHESGGDEGGLSAMSVWARRAPADEPAVPDESQNESLEPATFQVTQEHAEDVADDDDRAPSAKLNDEPPSEPDTSRWGGIFGHDAETEEDNGLAAMSAWARHRSAEQDQPAEAGPQADGAPAEQGDDGPKSWAEIRALRQKQHEEEILRNSGTATSRWESMFNVKPGEAGQARPDEGDEAGDDDSQGIQSEGLAAMRAWIEKGPLIDDDDDHPRRILAGDDDEAEEETEAHAPRPIRADLLEPFDWERDDSPAAPADVPAEIMEPFDWESDEPARAADSQDRHGIHLVTEEDDAGAPSVDDETQPWEVHEPAPVAELPAEVAAEAPAIEAEPQMAMPSEYADADLSLFGDLDAQPLAAEARPEPRQQKRGLFGRLFGRRTSEPGEAVSETDQAKPDWFAVDDGSDDLRTVTPLSASLDAEPMAPTAGAVDEHGWATDEADTEAADPAAAWRSPEPQFDADEAAPTTPPGTEDSEPATAWRWPDARAADDGETETAAVADDEPWQRFGTDQTAAALEPEPSAGIAETNETFAESAASGASTFASAEAGDEAGDWAPEPFQFPATPPASDLAFEAVVAAPEDSAAVAEPVALEDPIADLEDEAPWAAEFAADGAEVDEQTFDSPVAEAPAAVAAEETAEDTESTWSWDFDDQDEETAPASDPVASVSEDEFAWVPTDAGDGDAPAEAWLAANEQPAELPLPSAFHDVALDPEMDEDPWRAVAEADADEAPAAMQPVASLTDDASDEPWAAVDALDAASDDADNEDWQGSEDDAETLAPAAELEDVPGPEPADASPPGRPFGQDDPWAEFISRREREVNDEERVAAERWNDVFGTAPQGKSDAEAGDGDQASAEAATAEFSEAEPFDTDSYSDAREPMTPPAAGSDADDPWAAIAAASGYDAATDSGMAVYKSEEPEPQPEDDPWESFTASHQRYVEETPPVREALRPPEPVTPPAARWDDDEANLSPDEFIVRAFERKAAEQLPEEREAVGSVADIDEGVTSLLGDEGEAIMRETAESEAGPRSFARMSAWAPQRTGRRVENPNEAPWESDYPEDDDEFRGLGGPSYEPPLNADVPPPPFPPSDAFDGFDPQPVPMGVKRSKTKTWVREVVETGLLALLVFLSVRASFQNFKVDGSSMYPTLQNGQFLIVNKLEYSQVDMDKLSNFVPFVDPGSNPKRNVFHPPQRGDIVVLQDPRKPDTDLIKRIIALPGETVEIVNGRVYINDHLLEEPYIKSPWHDTKAKITIPEGQYYVLGDNRDNSLDSRSSQVGLVPEDLIIGKAMLSYWPLDRFGLAPNDGGDISAKDGPPRLTTQAVPAH